VAQSANELFEELVQIMARLRGENGCPWDREQTHQSIKPYFVEETYEVLEAIDEDDAGKLCEELGDVMLQVVFHARMAEEAALFQIGDVLRAINEKLVRRHPHVFGAADGGDARPLPATPDEVVERWEELKSRETGSTGEQRTALGGVPKVLPALLRTHEIGIRASAAGFDWERASDVVAKIEEEVAELREWVGAGASGNGGRAEEEMGDLLFAIANLSRKLGIEPESALRKANDKFSRRFTAMESRLRAAGRPLSACSLQEMEDEWSRVKLAEREAAAGPDAAPAAGR
jgi:MazG family protein